MKIWSFFLALAVVLSPAAMLSASAQTWTQTGAPITNWQAVALSADGSKFVAVSGGQTATGAIYISTNSGANWTTAAAPRTNWSSIACSSDGNHLVVSTYSAAGAPSGGIYYSSDFGATWSSNKFGNQWLQVISSADGSKLAGVLSANRIHLSTNGGTSWFSNTVPVFDLRCGASSADGSRLVLGNNVGAILVSTNGGANWTQPATLSGNVTSLAGSADGMKLVAVSAAAPGPRVYTSTNGGNNWTSNSVPARSDWFACASSADGSCLAALGQKGVIYTSTNSGALWISNNVPGLQWQSAAFSADGSTLLAAAVKGGIWISQVTPAPQLNITTSEGGSFLSWLVPATNFVLQQNSDLATTNWTVVTNFPVLNLTNLHYEITLPQSGDDMFYRLATP